ncbi:helix-turn-helix transcriptional regulator [Portibacter marinus]|uniref:helix-turn-helix transcriptional regulator n=1 Tax=Portibacter marinus TaxID=2898660 RepID=UPI001F354680|nr:hypothetical protein [Portibacter marinus]
MKQKIGFDHLIGEENKKLSKEELKLYQRIVQSHSAEQPIEIKRSIEHINISLQMQSYLESDNSDVTTAGAFLERLLKIYEIKKSQFAEFIDIERTNFYALLKGRRKFNISIATKVGEIFKIDPELWLFIEAKNEMKEYKCEKSSNARKYTLANLLNER